MCNLYSITTNQAAIAARRISRYSGPSDPQRRHRHRDDPDALGHAATPADWRPASHKHPQHVIAALAYVAEAGEPLPMPPRRRGAASANTCGGGASPDENGGYNAGPSGVARYLAQVRQSLESGHPPVRLAGPLCAQNRKNSSEYIFSALPLRADIAQCSRRVRFNRRT
jgi:hypothetical protein